MLFINHNRLLALSQRWSPILQYAPMQRLSLRAAPGDASQWKKLLTLLR